MRRPGTYPGLLLQLLYSGTASLPPVWSSRSLPCRPLLHTKPSSQWFARNSSPDPPTPPPQLASPAAPDSPPARPKRKTSSCLYEGYYLWTLGLSRRWGLKYEVRSTKYKVEQRCGYLTVKPLQHLPGGVKAITKCKVKTRNKKCKEVRGKYKFVIILSLLFCSRL